MIDVFSFAHDKRFLAMKLLPRAQNTKRIAAQTTAAADASKQQGALCHSKTNASPAAVRDRHGSSVFGVLKGH